MLKASQHTLQGGTVPVSYLVLGHDLNLVHDGHVYIRTWQSKQPGDRQSEMKHFVILFLIDCLGEKSNYCTNNVSKIHEVLPDDFAESAHRLCWLAGCDEQQSQKESRGQKHSPHRHDEAGSRLQR